MNKEDMRIVFMGTPEFAVPSLKALHNAEYNIVGAITSPDRPSGRGRKVRYSPVKEYVVQNDLYLMQPEKLKNENFIKELKTLNANLQVVVAFRMLPKQVWDMPEFGTFNLHASLLPQYRGAAPINHAIMNGEKVSGLTTFFLDENIDTGRIISQVKIEIGKDENFGQLHDRMKSAGAKLVVNTVEKIRLGKNTTIAQENLSQEEELKTAPKIFKEDCAIDWSKSADEIHNFIRGLSPNPGAVSFLHTNPDKKYIIKILKSTVEPFLSDGNTGQIITDQRNYLKVVSKNGLIDIIELQMEGKRRMATEEFLRGFKVPLLSFFE